MKQYRITKILFADKNNMIGGTQYFKRLVKDCKKMNPNIRIKRIRLGFYRIYWKQTYIHEVYKDLPFRGYDIDELNTRLENKSYYEEYEDKVELTRNIKNYVEGYSDAIERIRTRVYLMKHDDIFNEQSTKAYAQVVVK